MDELDEKIRMIELYDIYGGLIKSKQKEILDDYFDYNMTLSEIAEEKNISKQAVYDLIKKKCDVLENYEKVLKLLEIKNNINVCIKNVKDNNFKKVEEILNNILEEI